MSKDASWLFSSFVKKNGTQSDLDLIELIDTETLINNYSIKNNQLEESLEIGIMEDGLIASAIWVLTSICGEILKDGYKITKKNLLLYIEKKKNEPSKTNRKEEDVLNEYELILREEINKSSD